MRPQRTWVMWRWALCKRWSSDLQWRISPHLWVVVLCYYMFLPYRVGRCGQCPRGYEGDGTRNGCVRRPCLAKPCFPGVACQDLPNGNYRLVHRQYQRAPARFHPHNRKSASGNVFFSDSHRFRSYFAVENCNIWLVVLFKMICLKMCSLYKRRIILVLAVSDQNTSCWELNISLKAFAIGGSRCSFLRTKMFSISCIWAKLYAVAF